MYSERPPLTLTGRSWGPSLHSYMKPCSVDFSTTVDRSSVSYFPTSRTSVTYINTNKEYKGVRRGTGVELDFLLVF